VEDFRVSVSADGERFLPVTVERQDCGGAGDCGHWKPVINQATNIPAGNRFFRLEFGVEAELGRLEAEYDY
jgi:hypothetical protein